MVCDTDSTLIKMQLSREMRTLRESQYWLKAGWGSNTWAWLPSGFCSSWGQSHRHPCRKKECEVRLMEQVSCRCWRRHVWVCTLGMENRTFVTVNVGKRQKCVHKFILQVWGTLKERPMKMNASTGCGGPEPPVLRSAAAWDSRMGSFCGQQRARDQFHKSPARLHGLSYPYSLIFYFPVSLQCLPGPSASVTCEETVTGLVARWATHTPNPSFLFERTPIISFSLN